MLDYKIVEHMGYEWPIVVYFFLGGLSVGSYFLSVVANYWKKEFKPLAKTAAIVSPITLGIGMLFLIFDLGQPLRFWRIFLHFNRGSAISWGTWLINIFFLSSLVYAWFAIRGEEEKARKYVYFGLPLGFFVATYTAIILAQAPGKELWRHIIAIVPWLFLIGGIISGIALVMLLSVGRVDRTILAKLGKFLASLILLELVIVFVDVVVLLNGGTEAVESAKSFLVGDYSFLFWVIEIILGSLIPIFILLKSKASAKGYVVASVLTLVGIYTMRYIVVIGGGHVPTY